MTQVTIHLTILYYEIMKGFFHSISLQLNRMPLALVTNLAKVVPLVLVQKFDHQVAPPALVPNLAHI